MDSKQITPAPAPGFVAEIAQWAKNFATEFAQCWEQLPNKGFFLVLFAAWLLLFQFLGNATFGYINTPSLFHWMWNAYAHSIKGDEGQGAVGGGEDDQGILIPFVVMALFWWKRRELLSTPIRVWWPAILALAAFVALHMAGYLVQQPLVSIVALFGGIYALSGLAWGPRWLRSSFFPFFLFVFCIPVSSIAQPVTFPLRVMVSKTVGALCNNFLGMDVIREGTQLFNSQHTYVYEVAAACSGLRSFTAILALSTIYGFMMFEKNWKRIVMIAAAFPLAMLGNVLRMMGIIITADLFGQSAGNFVHENAFFSLVPYVPAIIGVMLLGRWLREPSPQPAATLLKPNPA